MKDKKSWHLPVGLFVAAILIHFCSLNSNAVDRYYSSGIYPLISTCLKVVFGWLPFSIGDILYGLVAGVLLYKLSMFVLRLFKGQLTTQLMVRAVRWVWLAMLWVYISFNVLWGINYNRTGIANQANIKLEKYTVQDLASIDSLLLLKVNASRAALVNKMHVNSTAKMRTETMEAYRLASSKYPFLHAETVSLKPSLWGWLGNYLDFSGYYNPFTGEAQVNTTVPVFIQPFTFCHEVGHQLGFAKENEANFAGYLAARESTDTAFHYSVYLDLFLYAQQNLLFADSATARGMAKKLSPEVKADMAQLRAFYQRHRNPFEPAVRWLYGKYLKNNQQPSGLLSYDEVVGLLIAYYKKYGKI